MIVAHILFRSRSRGLAALVGSQQTIEASALKRFRFERHVEASAHHLVNVSIHKCWGLPK